MRFRSVSFFILTAAACFLSASTAMAATIYVNSSTGDDTTGNGGTGSPYKTFNKAYTVAAASGDTIDLTGTFDWSNASETGDTSGSGYTLAKSLTIQGQGASSTFIQASSTENTADRRVFTVNAGTTVTIKNLTIRYGVSTTTESAGGIANSGTLTIQSATLSYNRYNSTANYYGAGAIELPNSANAVLTISTSTIAHNTFNGKYYGAGGIFAGQSNTITITGSTFDSNTSISSDPSTFAYSYADPSGAFGVFRFVTTIVTNCTFSNNSTNSYGGALQIYYPNSFKITNSTIANNTASLGAGGILFESVTSGYNLSVKNTIIANNTGNSTSDDFYVVSSSAGMVTDNGYNIVEYSTNKTWNAAGDVAGNQTSLNLATTLADNSALNGVQTLALSSGSVAINAGDTVANSAIVIPSYDERGGTRSGATDIGAFEYGGGGLADTTAPSVSISAPSSGGTVSGTTSLAASASDNVGVAGVSFYVDNTLQGSEDTTSPYALSWDSTATSSATHSVFAVARDTSNNYATSTAVSFTVDNTAPALSSVAAATTSSTATITWTTDEAGSSQINFGLTSSYGTSTAESDTSSRVMSHSVVVSDLVSCTRYHYQAQSKDSVGNTGTSTDSTLITAGCTGSSGISSTAQQNSITTAAGGTLSNGDLTLTIPPSFTSTSSAATFQANQLDVASFFAGAGTPSGVQRIGNDVFNLKALTDATTTLATFSAALSVRLSYTASDIVGINETTLTIYRYDGSSWNPLSTCSVDTSARTVTCQTTAFSDFALFGQTAAASVSTSSSNGPIFSGDASALPGYVAPRPQMIYPDGTVKFLDEPAVSSSSQPYVPANATTTTSARSVSGDTKISTSRRFTENLRAGSIGGDVRNLQRFLNTHGALLAKKGAGSPGNETDYFGTRTYDALIEFQNMHIPEILAPLGLTRGTGIFGVLTRQYANAMLIRE